jgi:hypothetical protein
MPFVYVKVPLSGDALEDHHVLHGHLAQALDSQQLGAILSWGGSLGDLQRDGGRPVAFHRIDIEVMDLSAARSLLQRTLAQAGVPAGTELHCTVAQRPQVDVLGPEGWTSRLS